MEPIYATVERVLKGWRKQKASFKKDEILNRKIKHIFTKQELKHIRYCLLKDKQVVIGVDSSVWIFKLSIKKAQLLKRVNQNLQGEVHNLLLRLTTESKDNGTKNTRQKIF